MSYEDSISPNILDTLHVVHSTTSSDRQARKQKKKKDEFRKEKDQDVVELSDLVKNENDQDHENTDQKNTGKFVYNINEKSQHVDIIIH